MRRGRKKEIPKLTKEELLRAIILYLGEHDEKFIDKLLRYVNIEKELEERKRKYEELKSKRKLTRGEKVALSKLSKQIKNIENLLKLLEE